MIENNDGIAIKLIYMTNKKDFIVAGLMTLLFVFIGMASEHFVPDKQRTGVLSCGGNGWVRKIPQDYNGRQQQPHNGFPRGSCAHASLCQLIDDRRKPGDKSIACKL